MSESREAKVTGGSEIEVCAKGFPSSSAGKGSSCNAGDLGLIPGLGRFPRGGHGSPLQYSYLETPHGQSSLEGYSPWDHMTERLST